MIREIVRDNTVSQSFPAHVTGTHDTKTMNGRKKAFIKSCRALGVAFWLAVLLLWPAATHVSAEKVPPTLPYYLYGEINVLPGSTIVAAVNVEPIAQTTVFSAGGKSVYRLALPADDPQTPGREGAHENEVVHFTVGGYPLLEKVIWHSGHIDRIDLHRAKLPFGYFPLMLHRAAW